MDPFIWAAGLVITVLAVNWYFRRLTLRLEERLGERHDN